MPPSTAFATHLRVSYPWLFSSPSPDRAFCSGWPCWVFPRGDFGGAIAVPKRSDLWPEPDAGLATDCGKRDQLIHSGEIAICRFTLRSLRLGNNDIVNLGTFA